MRKLLILVVLFSMCSVANAAKKHPYCLQLEHVFMNMLIFKSGTSEVQRFADYTGKTLQERYGPFRTSISRILTQPNDPEIIEGYISRGGDYSVMAANLVEYFKSRATDDYFDFVSSILIAFNTGQKHVYAVPTDLKLRSEYDLVSWLMDAIFMGNNMANLPKYEKVGVQIHTYDELNIENADYYFELKRNLIKAIMFNRTDLISQILKYSEYGFCYTRSIK